MTITVNSLAVVQDNASPDQTNATGSITPTANSRVLVFTFHVTDGGNTYYDPQISTTITGWTSSLTRISRSSDIAISFDPGFCVFEGVMGGSPAAGTITIDWHTTADTAYGTFQVIELVGSSSLPTHKQTMAAAKVEDDAGGNSETQTTNALGSAATTGDTCIVSFGSSKDGGVAVATPSGWTAVGTPGSANYAQIGVFSKTDFTGTSVTCTDLGDIVDSSGSALLEFEEAGGIDQEGFRFRNDDGSETTATWKASQDTNVTSPLSANIRLRTLVNAAGDPGATAYTLRYKKSTDSVYIPVQVGSAPTGTAPVIEGTAESNVTSAGTSHAITLPASIASTDLVIILMDIGSTSATLNALTDWTEDLDEASANGLKILRYTGTGVPGNPTFTSSASTKSASIAYRISGADKTIAPQIGTTATGTSVNPNPPSVTPTGGTSKPYLFLAFFGSAGEEADDDTWVTAAPSGYTGLLQKTAGTTGTNLGGLIGAASRTNTSGSAEDPATFTMAVSAAWRAQTVIIHPTMVTPPIYVSPSANVTAGGEATTAQLTAPSGKTTSDFDTGRMWDDENGTDTIDITLDDYTEVEWCLQAQSPAANADIYQFRVYAGATPFTTYTFTPEWTIGTPSTAGPPPIPRRRPQLTYR